MSDLFDGTHPDGWEELSDLSEEQLEGIDVPKPVKGKIEYQSTPPSSNLSNEIEEELFEFYGKSVDAYHAFMGTYTDAESDETAPDRLIEEYKDRLTTLFNKQIVAELNKIVELGEAGYIEAKDRIKELEK